MWFRGVLSWGAWRISGLFISLGWEGEEKRRGYLSSMELTIPLFFVPRFVENASQPRIRLISWTRDLVSRALVELERRRDNLAWRHGCWEMWTFEGKSGGAIPAVDGGERVMIWWVGTIGDCLWVCRRS